MWASFEHVDNPCFAKYEAPEDNFGVTAAGQPSEALLAMFREFHLDPALLSALTPRAACRRRSPMNRGGRC
jgi:hypothetical protein